MTTMTTTWKFRATETTTDKHAVACDLVEGDLVVARCVWQRGQRDTESEGLGVTAEGSTAGWTEDDVYWPSEREAVEAAHGDKRWCVLHEEGGDYDRIWATPDEALAIAVEGVDRGNYDGDEENLLRPLWIHVAVVVELDGRRSIEASQTVLLDGEEPECPHTRSGEHDWKEDYLRGNGGGVVEHEICRLCGAGRLTDTWAHDPETGDQGWTATSYEPCGEHEVEPVLTDWGVTDETGKCRAWDVPADEAPEEDESPRDYLSRLAEWAAEEVRGNSDYANEDGRLPSEVDVVRRHRGNEPKALWVEVASAWVEDQSGDREEVGIYVTEYEALEGDIRTAKWRYEAAPTCGDPKAVGCDLVAADGTTLASCLWSGHDLDIDSDGCGLTSAAYAQGLRQDDIEWPSEREAVDAVWGDDSADDEAVA